MRIAIFSLLFFFTACGDIVPVDTINLCHGSNPPSNECAQCRTIPYAADCPRCRTNPPDADCADAKDDAGSGSGGSNASSGGKGGKGGSGSGGTHGGSGGDAMLTDGGSGTSGSGGVTGSGGDGGNAAPCDACGGDKPKCLDDACVQCVGDGDCDDDDSAKCEPESHSCVQCLENDDCDSGTPLCDKEAHQCVECLTDTECTTDGAGQCNGGVCGACSDNDACARHVGHAYCDTSTGSETLGECVECLKNADCDASAPLCNADRECVACTSDAPCADRDGKTICDTDSWADTHGQCVECTGTKYAKCKVGSTNYVCDSQQRECSTEAAHTKGNTGVCGGCISDAECNTGQVCVKMEFGTPAKAVGWFCQWKESATGSGAPAGTCANVKPFFKTSPFGNDDPDVLSVDHANVTICTLRNSTCPAYSDYNDSEDCNVGTVQSPNPDDGSCGFDYTADPGNDQTSGNQDAYCVLAATDTYRCTMRCASSDDCKAGVACNGSSRCDIQ